MLINNIHNYNNSKKVTIVAILLSTFFLSNMLFAKTLKVDLQQSEVLVKVFKSGIASKMAHDHIISARDFSGNVEFDPSFPNQSSISLTVKTNSLKVDEPEFRKRYIVGDTISLEDIEKTEVNMKSASQLNVAKFPEIVFKSTNITHTSANNYQVTGQMTIRGVTKTISFVATVAYDGSFFTGKAEIKIKQTDFGIEPYSVLLGSIKNKDELVLAILIVAN